MAASKKAAFYEELERLDCTTDDDDAGARDRDGAEFERLLRASRKEAVLPQGLECQDAPMGRVERRACAVPEESPQQVVVDLVEEPTVRPSSSSGQHRDESSAIATTRPRLAGLLSDSLEPLVPKKRRRRQSAALKLMPEEQQIFKDFTFCTYMLSCIKSRVVHVDDIIVWQSLTLQSSFQTTTSRHCDGCASGAPESMARLGRSSGTAM